MFCTGLLGGMPVAKIVEEFSIGSQNGVGVALSYSFLGVFAAAISEIGFAQYLAAKVLGRLRTENTSRAHAWVVQGLLLTLAIMSQNLLPIHIAFIPIFVPPLLAVMNRVELDRRRIACIFAFGLVTPYMLLPFGFGAIFLRNIVLGAMEIHGVPLSLGTGRIVAAMALPALGMLLGLAFALGITYRKNRAYAGGEVQSAPPGSASRTDGGWAFSRGLLSIAALFFLQIRYGSILIGALGGVAILLALGAIPWNKMGTIADRGFQMMAGIGVIMIVASGYARVLSSGGHLTSLIEGLIRGTGGNASLAIWTMLLLGWLLTLGIGSSFSAVPILASLYVPAGVALGLPPIAIFVLLATAGALGDAGSPVSDTAIGSTAGLNCDGQHDHIRDTIWPTLFHFNVPLLLCGYLAVRLLSR
jgi:predicted histidine transporter YuiF (NhaC family)